MQQGRVLIKTGVRQSQIICQSNTGVFYLKDHRLILDPPKLRGGWLKVASVISL